MKDFLFQIFSFTNKTSDSVVIIYKLAYQFGYYKFTCFIPHRGQIQFKWTD